MGSTPATDRSPPAKVSSPTNRLSLSAAAGIVPSAASTATAIARSKWVPRLARSAGESRIVMRLVAGQRRVLLMMAIRHRSRASLMATSARPTTVVPTIPLDTSACTSMRWPTAPDKDMV